MTGPYASMPSISDMLAQLSSTPGLKPAKQPLRIARKYLGRSGYVGLTVSVVTVLWLGRTPFPILAVFVTSLVAVASSFVIEFWIDVRQNKDMFLDPARQIARSIDNQYVEECELAIRLARLPATEINEHLGRIEAHVAALEKWIDVTRLVLLLGPAVLILMKFWKSSTPTIAHDFAQLAISAAVAGALFGAIQLRSGLLRLTRVACTLRIALDRGAARKIPRKVSRQRRAG